MATTEFLHVFDLVCSGLLLDGRGGCLLWTSVGWLGWTSVVEWQPTSSVPLLLKSGDSNNTGDICCGVAALAGLADTLLLL